MEVQFPSTILGDTDERTQVANTKISPYLKTAFIRMTFNNVYNNSDNSYHNLFYIGTAFLEGPNIAVTAGHCVYYDVTNSGDYKDYIDNPRFPDRIEFYFGISSESEISSSYTYYAEATVLNIEYSYYISPNFDHDWAVVELDRNIGNTVGWHGRTANWYDIGAPVNTHGYPGDKPRATMWKMTGSFYRKTDFRYYTNNIDTAGGQSGSPYLITYLGSDDYVCGIHTFGDSSDTPEYNGGTILNMFIFHYISSFTTSYSGTRQYDYPSLSVIGKSGSTWKITIKNTSSAGINLIYNSKMCFLSDAKNWTGLKDTVMTYLSPYSSVTVSIAENLLATSITCSYIRNNYRIISYANNLSSNGTLSSYTNLVAV